MHRLLQTEGWLQRVLQDNSAKEQLINELKAEQETLKLGRKKDALEWLAKKLALVRQVKHAHEEIARRAQESASLRAFIFRQLKAHVRILRPPTTFELPYCEKALVDPAVLGDPRWIWVTEDTTFIWGVDGPDGEKTQGMAAFAVFHRPNEVMAHEATFLSLFEHLREFRYPLKRHFITEGGKCYGIGFRAGYESGLSFGIYRCPRRAEESGEERALHPENLKIEELAVLFAQILEETFHRRLPTDFDEKAEVVELEELPTLEGSVTTALLPTEGYYCMMHKDQTDKGCADGVWLEQHNPSCKRHLQGKSCCKHWAFLFPEYNIAVPISNGTCIMWQGAQIYHGTVLRKHKNACKGHKAFSVVTQIKNALIERVRAKKQRENN